MTVLYTAVATASSGRDGRVKSSDGVIDLAVVTPPGMGGPGNGPAGTNPEQLFAAGYSACFGGALRLVALKQKVNPAGFTTTAHVSFVKEGNDFGIAVEMHATLPGLPKEQAQALVEAAHQVCPYSRATRGNIPVTLVVDA